MELAEFCTRLSMVQGLDHTKRAVAILWWHDLQSAGADMTVRELADVINANGLGNPNVTGLKSKLTSSRLTLRGDRGFRLKAGAESTIRGWLGKALECAMPRVELDSGYLPYAVWRDTRGYIEKVCVQMNGCYQYEFFDGASVMMRRVVETLIIECYEHLNRATEIKNSDGNYLMLSALVDKCLGTGGLTLGREAKTALGPIKALGDRSAHNRRCNANRADMDRVRDGLRVVAEELIAIAALR